MPLVEYDSSDEESEEEPVEETARTTQKVLKFNEDQELALNPLKGKNKTEEENPEEDSLRNLPVSSLPNQDVFWDLLSKKPDRTQPVKIFAPEIPEIDPEDKVKKSLKKSVKGSSLIALLPSPKKKATSLTPAQVKTVAKPIAKKIESPKVAAESAVVATKNRVETGTEKEEEDEEDDDGIEGADFLGLSRANSSIDPGLCLAPDPAEAGGTSESLLDQRGSEPTSSIPLPPTREGTKRTIQEATAAIPVPPEGEVLPDNPEPFPVELDDNALTQLCGSKGKRKRWEEAIEMIDVDASSLLSDSKDWHTKELTVERRVASHKKSHGPTSQQRRKHQITYLAFQAKEQELELTNQWAANRMTRKQTQAKYGF